MPKKPLIALDPGHGGSDGGAVYDGIREADLNLAISRVARSVCSVSFPNAAFTTTRENDRTISLSERGDLAARADLVISVHCNANSSSSLWGPRVYYWPGNSMSGAVGKSIIYASHSQHNVGGRLVTVRRDDPNVDGDEWLNRPYNVVAAFAAPTVLYETMFMTNHQELMLLRSEEGKQIAALAIARGVAEFLAHYC